MVMKSVVGVICCCFLAAIVLLQLVKAQDIITTIAGGGDDSGNEIAATSASLGYCFGVALDSSGINTVLSHYFLIFCSLTDLFIFR